MDIVTFVAGAVFFVTLIVWYISELKYLKRSREIWREYEEKISQNRP